MNPRSYNSPPQYVEDAAFLAGEKTLLSREPTPPTSHSQIELLLKSKEDSPAASAPNSAQFAPVTSTGESYYSSAPTTSYPGIPTHDIPIGLRLKGSSTRSKNSLPTSSKERKGVPIATGVLDYFPKALAEVARVSLAGNKQHFPPGTPLHWEKGLSNDHADAAVRHLMERGTHDVDGQRHSAKLAWRALALLETEIENENINGP